MQDFECQQGRYRLDNSTFYYQGHQTPLHNINTLQLRANNKRFNSALVYSLIALAVFFAMAPFIGAALIGADQLTLLVKVGAPVLLALLVFAGSYFGQKNYHLELIKSSGRGGVIDSCNDPQAFNELIEQFKQRQAALSRNG